MIKKLELTVLNPFKKALEKLIRAPYRVAITSKKLNELTEADFKNQDIAKELCKKYNN